MKNIYKDTPLKTVNKFRINSESRIDDIFKELGNSKKEIAKTLKEENVVGSIGRCNGCPLSNYLTLRGGAFRFEVSLKKETGLIAVSFEIKGFAFHHIYNNIAIADFIRGFDNGEFPYLDVAKINSTETIDKGW